MIDYMVWVWLGIVAGSIIIELVTFQLVTIWFAAGGIVALILAVCGVPMEWQIVSFLIASIALLLGMRQISLKWLNRGEQAKTNIDALVGKKAELLEPIQLNKPGAVKFNGVMWSTYTKTSCNVQAGTMVEIVSVDGNKLIVKPVDAKAADCQEEQAAKTDSPTETPKAKPKTTTVKKTTKKETKK